MIGKKYQNYKKIVLELVEYYKTIINDMLKENFSTNIKMETLDRHLKSYYALAIVGEGKAGKSTFINALIGEEILPTGPLQATNEIVKIIKKKDISLKVTYAGKEEKTAENKNISIEDIRESLKKICSVQEQYRCIPTPLIDSYIITKEGKPEINELLESLKNENFKKIEKEIVEKYLKERPIESIPIEIQIGFPLKWEFDEFILVDSPGVNASGGIQDKTFKYLENANAYLFVKDIKQAESKSFMDFFEKTIQDSDKESLFLILTHASNHIEDEIKELYEETSRLYGNLLDKNRIHVVENILKLIENDLEKGINIDEISMDKKKKLVMSKYFHGHKNIDEMVEIIKCNSGFEALDKALDEFTFRAPFHQLRTILSKILKKGYDEISKKLDEDISLLKKSLKNPQELEAEINKRLNALKRIETELSEKTKKIEEIFLLLCQKLDSDLSSLETEVNDKIDNVKSYNDFKDLPKLCAGLADKLINLFKTNTTRVISEFEKNMQEINDNVKINIEQFAVPAIDLKSIEDEVHKHTPSKLVLAGKILATLCTGFLYGLYWWWNRKKYEEAISKSKDEVKSNIKNQIFSTKDEISSLNTTCWTMCIEETKNSFNKRKIELENLYIKVPGTENINNIKSEIEMNEKRSKKIEILTKYSSDIKEEMNKIDEVLSNLWHLK